MSHLLSIVASSRRLKGLCAASLGLLTACGGPDVCTPRDEPYLSARSREPLQVPSGLSAPNRSDALAIPDAQPKPSPAGRTSCLDEPPSYFSSAGTFARSPEEVVASWAHAWANREADAVVALYSKDFEAPTDASGASVWLEQRREQVATGPVPDATIEALTVESDGADRRVAKFVQRFGANALRKELTLVRESGSWRIVEEKVAGVK